MERREFILGSLAGVSTAALGGCATAATGDCAKPAAAAKPSAPEAKILFGACRSIKDAPLLKRVGYDFFEWGCANAFIPDKDDEAWKRQRDLILAAPLPLRSSNGFIPGKFRLTGPKADFGPALDYGERVLRRAEEVGVKTIVFGSGGARNVPGDMTAADRKTWPNLELGAAQYAEFCRQLCRRVADLKTVTVVIEPLRPNESNIVNFVWQGVQICEDVGSPRLGQLADLFHMMMGRESADSIVRAGALLKHCHIASYGTREFPGHDPATVARFKPYFEALRKIGYQGGVSCECGWSGSGGPEKTMAVALETMRGLAQA